LFKQIFTVWGQCCFLKETFNGRTHSFIKRVIFSLKLAVFSLYLSVAVMQLYTFFD